MNSTEKKKDNEKMPGTYEHEIYADDGYTEMDLVHWIYQHSKDTIIDEIMGWRTQK